MGRPLGVVDLDVYGEVVAAYGVSTSGPGGGAGAGPLSGAWPDLAGAIDWVADHWGEPDAGVWGSAGPPALLVASRVQVWAALDRMARLGRAANPLDLQAATWHQEARQVLTWLEANGVAADGGLRRDGRPGRADEPDAALLRIAWRGPWPLAHPIVTATVDRVLEQLGSDSFVYRYSPQVDDGRAGPDNPDLLASLWAVRALAQLGRWEEAHTRHGGGGGGGGRWDCSQKRSIPCRASSWATSRRRPSTWPWWTRRWRWRPGRASPSRHRQALAWATCPPPPPARRPGRSTPPFWPCRSRIWPARPWIEPAREAPVMPRCGSSAPGSLTLEPGTATSKAPPNGNRPGCRFGFSTTGRGASRRPPT